MRRPTMIYGFPMDDAITSRIADGAFPIPPHVKGAELEDLEFARIEPIVHEIEEACGEVWDYDYVKSMAAFANGKAIGVMVVGWGNHLPDGETLEALRKVMAEPGFHEEPGWFRRLSSLTE